MIEKFEVVHTLDSGTGVCIHGCEKCAEIILTSMPKSQETIAEIEERMEKKQARKEINVAIFKEQESEKTKNKRYDYRRHEWIRTNLPTGQRIASDADGTPWTFALKPGEGGPRTWEPETRYSREDWLRDAQY
jgi:hypothetical protein